MKGIEVAVTVLLFVFPVFAVPPQGGVVGVRLIAVPTEAEALDLRTRIRAGASFDELAREHSTAPSGADGGYLGQFEVAAMRTEFRDALAGLSPGESSLPVAMGGEYLLLGILSVPEQLWREEFEAGLQALRDGDDMEAAARLEAALDAAGSFGSGDYRRLSNLSRLANFYFEREGYDRALAYSVRWEVGIAESRLVDETEVADGLQRLGEILLRLGRPEEAEPFLRRSVALLEGVVTSPDRAAAALRTLALVRRDTGDLAEAEGLSRRAVTILDSSPEVDSVSLAASLHELSLILGDRLENREAEEVARRSLSLFEGALGPDDPAVADSLVNLAGLVGAQGRHDRALELYRRALAILTGIGAPANDSAQQVWRSLARAVRLSGFRGERFDAAAVSLREAIRTVSPPEDAYDLIATLLARHRLEELAELVMADAVEAFPDSWAVRGRLGTLYALHDKVARAIETFGEVTRMERAPSVWVAYGYRSIGELESGLSRFAEAEAAYEAALALEPESVAAHLGLGYVYFRGQRPEQARASYLRAIELDPEGFAPNFRLAEVSLSMGRFEEAAAAAEKALESDPQHPEALFVRARALMLQGEAGPVAATLERYRIEIERRDRPSRRKDRVRALRGQAHVQASARDDEAAAETLEGAVAAYPDEAGLRLDLAAVLADMGRHADAIGALEAIVADPDQADFTVYFALAEEYSVLGETALSRAQGLAWRRALYFEIRDLL